MDKKIVVRFWNKTKDGDASPEGILELNKKEHEAGGGPLYAGSVVDKKGRKVWVTIN